MSPYKYLDNLIDKSLVTLDKNVINMHALVQKLGLHIGKEEGSHLRKVMKFRVQNGDKVRALKLANIGRDFEVNVKKFKEMPNLHFLVLNECVLYGNNKDIFEEVRYLQLRNCTIKHLLCMPNLSNLVSLDMSESSKFIKSEFALEGYPNLLALNLSKCGSITSLPYSIGHLSKLQVLNLTDCGQLQKLPDSIDHLISLQELLLGGCESLVALPKFITRLRDHSYVCTVSWGISFDIMSTHNYEIENWQRNGYPSPPNFSQAIEFGCVLKSEVPTPQFQHLTP